MAHKVSDGICYAFNLTFEVICDVFIELALTLAGGHGGNGSMADGESNNSTVSFFYLFFLC